MTTVDLRAKEVMPHNADAEEAVLGSILIDGECLGQVEFLLPEDFYIERNRWVYQAALELRRAGQAVDYLTLTSRLDQHDRLREIGGPVRVMELINATPSSINVESYARLVKDEANRRKVLAVARELTQAAFDHQVSLAAAASKGLDQLSHTMAGGQGAVHISHYLEQLKGEVDQARAHPAENGVWGIPTGLNDMDHITGGLQYSEVWKLTGDPGVGKSLLAMQILTSAASFGHPGVLYELEMGGVQVARRSISGLTVIQNQAPELRHRQLATRAMRLGKITPDQYSAFIQALERMAKLPIYMSDNSYLTTAELRVDLVRLVENFGIEVVVIDYEGLLQDEAKDRNEHSMIVSNRVHALIKDLGLACISIGDVTKEAVQGKISGQGGMAGTARELHNADQIIFLKRKRDNLISVVWEKMREGDGEHGFDLIKLPGFPTFSEVAKPKKVP